MSDTNFRIRKVNGTIIMEKDNQGIAISQALDNDIWFSASEEEIRLEISMHSRDYSEWNTFIVLENLMKLIIGRYMLNSENKKEYSMLPDDFVNLDTKSIIWHSDSESDNILKIEYNKESIIISLLKSKKAGTYVTNAVRIRTSGSSYEYYYQEFLKFFRELNELEHRLNKPVEIIESRQEMSPISKRLSLFNKHKK